ncbi:MAG: YdbL family protein [Pseudomonadota bacterium]|nr:YdbL family protein [Pseudomonadota bacterium]
MMKTLRLPMAMLLLLFVAACVTINVYFPAEAAEKAADRIIRDVYGEEPAAVPEPQSWNSLHYRPSGHGNVLLDWFISSAQAGADLSVNTPAIRKLEADMEKRHRKLAPYYVSGAVGIANNGQLKIRDQKLVELKDRNNLKNLVSKENRDRDALYKEIAKANGHPEWEADIRQTFARRWVDNAPAGWWYTDKSGNWKQK